MTSANSVPGAGCHWVLMTFALGRIDLSASMIFVLEQEVGTVTRVLGEGFEEDVDGVGVAFV